MVTACEATVDLHDSQLVDGVNETAAIIINLYTMQCTEPKFRRQTRFFTPSLKLKTYTSDTSRCHPNDMPHSSRRKRGISMVSVDRNKSKRSHAKPVSTSNVNSLINCNFASPNHKNRSYIQFCMTEEKTEKIIDFKLRNSSTASIKANLRVMMQGDNSSSPTNQFSQPYTPINKLIAFS